MTDTGPTLDALMTGLVAEINRARSSGKTEVVGSLLEAVTTDIEMIASRIGVVASPYLDDSRKDRVENALSLISNAVGQIRLVGRELSASVPRMDAGIDGTMARIEDDLRSMVPPEVDV